MEGATPNADPQGVAQVLLVLELSLEQHKRGLLVEIFDLLASQPVALPESERPANLFLLYVAEERSDPVCRCRTCLRRCGVFIRSR